MDETLNIAPSWRDEPNKKPTLARGLFHCSSWKQLKQLLWLPSP
jgi:hypothetical protein